uniref:Rootletin-like coiled-coil domain-containing protein n=1 Tax=Cyanoderma ruficeps TaxID=181631 RepID=A0A8C3QZT1_9PASS
MEKWWMLTVVKETPSFDITFPFFLKGSLPGRWEVTADHSLEKALLQVEEEQQRCENLAEVNTLLREHLNKASEVNSALKEDVGKLTVDWMRAREELELKEREWRGERELYDSYLRGEHNRLLSLWRQVVTFRRHFREMKTATDRDLSELKAEQMRLSGSILVNCTRLNSYVQLRESIPPGKPVLKDQAEQQMEPKINQTAQEVIALQVRWDMEKKELQDRVMELSTLLVQSQKQNEEKEKTMKTLNDTVEILVCFTFTWEIAQCLLSSLNTEMWLPQEKQW